MHCHCGTNNRAPRWTFIDPCKPEVRPGAWEESASPAWQAAPAMNARTQQKCIYGGLTLETKEHLKCRIRQDSTYLLTARYTFGMLGSNEASPSLSITGWLLECTPTSLLLPHFGSSLLPFPFWRPKEGSFNVLSGSLRSTCPNHFQRLLVMIVAMSSCWHLLSRWY